MWGHSLQAQPLSGGAAMNSLAGALFCIWWMIPGSVTTMKRLFALRSTWSRMPLVEPT